MVFLTDREQIHFVMNPFDLLINGRKPGIEDKIYLSENCVRLIEVFIRPALN